MKSSFTLEEAKWAKNLTIELWLYLARHPEIYRKSMVPDPLLKRIEGLINKCPLCHIFMGPHGSQYADPSNCGGCPLFEAREGCHLFDSPYNQWTFGEDRKKNAKKIVDIVSAWKPFARNEHGTISSFSMVPNFKIKVPKTHTSFRLDGGENDGE